MKCKVVVGLIAAVVAVDAAASERTSIVAQDQPKALTDLLACRKIAEPAGRLACFDANAGTLETATIKRDVMVVDREQMTKARRSLFGFTMPSLKIFGGNDDRDVPENQELATTIRAVSQSGDGRWIITVEDGAIWRQIDDTVLGRAPKPGTNVVIRKAMLTSFIMRILGQPGFKVHRDS